MPPMKKKMTGASPRPSESGRSLFGDTGVDLSGLDKDKKTLAETQRYRTQYIDLDKIRFYEYNKFRELDTSELEESIYLVGLIDPITLITKKDEETGKIYYEVIAGSRRFLSVTNLYKRALESNNKTDIERFQKIFALILPLGATSEEINRVYVDTNILHRPPSLTDMFKHIDKFLEKDENGKYVNLPEERPNVAKYVQARFVKLGYEYSLSKVKQYVSIFLAHNKEIQNDFINGFLTLNQAYTIAQMPNDLQDSMVEKFKNMTEKEIKEYLRVYNLKIKTEKTEAKRSVDVLQNLNSYKNQVDKLSVIKKIVLVNQTDRIEIEKVIDETIKALNSLKEKMN